MTVSLLTLPPEVAAHLVAFIDFEGLKSLRCTARHFEPFTSPLLFRHLDLRSNARTAADLLHPVLPARVLDVVKVLDMTLYNPSDINLVNAIRRTAKQAALAGFLDRLPSVRAVNIELSLDSNVVGSRIFADQSEAYWACIDALSRPSQPCLISLSLDFEGLLSAYVARLLTRTLERINRHHKTARVDIHDLNVTDAALELDGRPGSSGRMIEQFTDALAQTNVSELSVNRCHISTRLLDLLRLPALRKLSLDLADASDGPSFQDNFLSGTQLCAQVLASVSSSLQDLTVDSLSVARPDWAVLLGIRLPGLKTLKTAGSAYHLLELLDLPKLQTVTLQRPRKSAFDVGPFIQYLTSTLIADPWKEGHKELRSITLTELRANSGTTQPLESFRNQMNHHFTKIRLRLELDLIGVDLLDAVGLLKMFGKVVTALRVYHMPEEESPIYSASLNLPYLKRLQLLSRDDAWSRGHDFFPSASVARLLTNIRTPGLEKLTLSLHECDARGLDSIVQSLDGLSAPRGMQAELFVELAYQLGGDLKTSRPDMRKRLVDIGHNKGWQLDLMYSERTLSDAGGPVGGA